VGRKEIIKKKIEEWERIRDEIDEKEVDSEFLRNESVVKWFKNGQKRFAQKQIDYWKGLLEMPEVDMSNMQLIQKEKGLREEIRKIETKSKLLQAQLRLIKKIKEIPSV